MSDKTRKVTKRPQVPASSLLTDRRLMERAMAQAGRLLQSHEFASLEEANHYLNEALKSGGLPEIPPATPLEEAQEVVYQALEATGAKRTRLARRALEISPDCADAYVLLAEATKNPHAAKRLYEEGVRAGERALGPEAFEHDVGEFWGLLETRPYMRALEGLAQVEWYLGEHQEAIAHAQEMLRLNPNDNQGIRYVLASWLLAEGRDADLERLLKQYREDVSATWAYTNALAMFRREGVGRKADAALRKALKTNRFVPLFLLGLKKLPRHLPEYIGLGDENEAVAYIAEGAASWLATPGALEWFADRLIKELPHLATEARTTE